MASAPAYAATPNLGVVSIGTADTSLTAPAAAGTAWTAGANGGRVDVVTITAVAATTASSMVRLFVHNGSAYFLLKEIPVPVVTPSATQAAWNTSVTFSGGLSMATGFTLRATTNNGDDFHIVAQGGNF